MVEEKTHLAGVHAGNSRLPQATDQISSLIFLSHSIKVFSLKWKSIRNKLEEIFFILAALPQPIQDSGNNPTFSGVIQAIEETTAYSTKLAQKCLENSYSGKLLMQSDLDIIYVKFNNHIKSLSELIYTDDILTNGYCAIVVSRPGPTASRDDIKFYVKDLLTRFKIGGNEMKKQALISFNEVIQEDDRYVKIAMEIEGLDFILMEFLNSKEVRIQEEALKSVAVICGFDSYKSVLVGIGVVAPLIRVLESGSNLCKELSARCLIKVTENSDNAWSVSAHGGVTALLKICGGSVNGGESVGLACGVLRNLVGVEEIRRFTVEKGAIPMFIELVSSKNEVSQVNAIEFLQVMASWDESLRNLIVNEGGIHVLVRILDPKSCFSSKSREMSIRAIMRLCSDSIRSLNCLMNYGFMDYILYFLQNGDVLVQESSLKATFWLSRMSDEFKKAMGDLGFMQELVKFLDAKSFEVREMAAETLNNLVLVPKNRKRFVQNDQNVSFVLKLIDPEDCDSGTRNLLLSIILSITSCSNGRKKISSSGYLKNIQKLADLQVLGAKKIVRNVSPNLFSSMFRGIWHS